MPLVVFVMLVVIVLLMVGFACACFGEQPLKAAERTLGAGLSTPALIEMWALLVVILIAAPIVVGRRVEATGRASPALLQCFLH